MRIRLRIQNTAVSLCCFPLNEADSPRLTGEGLRQESELIHHYQLIIRYYQNINLFDIIYYIYQVMHIAQVKRRLLTFHFQRL
jgi:hypothetical protein